VRRVVQHQRHRVGGLGQPRDGGQHLVRGQRQPVRQDHLERRRPELLRTPDPGQRQLAAHLARAQLERDAPAAALGHRRADGVVLLLVEGVQLARAAAGVEAVEAGLEQHRELLVEPAEVDRLVLGHREEHRAPGAVQRLARQVLHPAAQATRAA
jgi:hypothetical protein